MTKLARVSDFVSLYLRSDMQFRRNDFSEVLDARKRPPRGAHW